MASAREHALHVAVTRSRADHVRSDDQARPPRHSAVDGVAQIDGRPLRIQSAHIAKRREAVAHVLLGIVKAGQRLGRRALQRLPRQIQAVDAKMNVGVDEAGGDRPVAEVDDIRTARTSDRVRHFGNAIVFDQDFRRSAHGVAQAVEEFATYDDRLCHSSLRSPWL